MRVATAAVVLWLSLGCASRPTVAVDPAVVEVVQATRALLDALPPELRGKAQRSFDDEC